MFDLNITIAYNFTLPWPDTLLISRQWLFLAPLVPTVPSYAGFHFACRPSWPQWPGGKSWEWQTWVWTSPSPWVLSRWSHTSDVQIGTLVVTLPGAWWRRINDSIGWPRISILWMKEIASLICNFYVTVASYNNNNNNNNRIQRRYSIFFTISSQRRELSPTHLLKWPGRNRVQIMCTMSSAYHLQVSCYVPLGTKGQLSY